MEICWYDAELEVEAFPGTISLLTIGCFCPASAEAAQG